MSRHMITVDSGKDVVHFDGCRWWADKGLIRWENESTGEYGTMSVRECLERLAGVNDMVGNLRTGDGYHFPDEVDKHQRYVQKMVDMCQRAKEQGTPDNDTARRDYLRRRRKTIVMPGPTALL